MTICLQCNSYVYEGQLFEVDEKEVCDACAEQAGVRVECVDCGQVVPPPQSYYIERYDKRICEECYNAYYTRCDACDELVHVDDTISDDYTTICDVCADDYCRCDDCGRLVHTNDVISDGYITICPSCYGDCYYRCYDCGMLVHMDDVEWCHDEPHCSDCAHEGVIGDYNYEPDEYLFDGEYEIRPGVLYMGVELEVDGGGEDHDNAQRVINELGADYVYTKRDGSLRNGFEIVTHPSTLAYHKQKRWQEALKLLRRMGYESHDAGTCGLHVHLTRAVFDEVDEAKLLYLVEKFWPQLVKFSRRTPGQLDQWAARYGLEDDETPEALLEKAKGRGRYYAVNLENYHTIEIRLFRGTLRYETLMATLEFCDYLFRVVKNSSVAEIQKLTWQEFVANIPESYEFLPNYLKERGLM